MDVDEGHPTTDLVSQFDLSSGMFPWREPILQEVETRRACMSDRLIFDILLSSGGILQPDTLYPPKDVESLRRLLDAIQNSTYDALKKECLVYFLLKWHKDGREERFRHEKCIPPQFTALADAYWHLDTGLNVARAVSILSDARLNGDYASKILQAISLSENPTPLILKYVQTAKPLLTEPDDIDMYAIALVESNLLDAWQFQRTFPAKNETRSRLIRKILDWCLSPKPRPQPLSQLLAFPFSAYEQALVHEYALHPPSTCISASIPVIQDLVCVRLIQSGQYSSAIKLDRQFSSTFTSNTTPKMQKAIQDRRHMLDEVMAAMPAAERDSLDAELETLTKGKSARPAWASSSGETMGSGDLSMSWEDVQLVRPAFGLSNIPVGKGTLVSTPVDDSHVVPLSERSGLPRYGSGFPLLPPHPHPSGSQKSSVSLSQSLFTKPAPTSQSHLSIFTQHHSSSPRGLPVPLIESSRPSFPAGLFAQNSSAHGSQPVLTPASLFGSTGSTNPTRDLINERVAMNGVKRSFEQDGPAAAPATVDHPPSTQNDDMNIDSEDDVARQLRSHENGDPRENSRDVDLSFSVFSQNTSGPTRRRVETDMETKGRVPPGAFISDSDEEVEEERARNKGHKRVSPQPPKRVQDVRVQKQAVREADLGRSLPGSLIVEEEEDGDEDEGHVAPLPASKRPARKGRTLPAGGHEGEGGESKRPRRSTRLSTAHNSVTSPSPESSPKKALLKPSKNTRALSSAAGTAKSGTRKKR